MNRNKKVKKKKSQRMGHNWKLNGAPDEISANVSFRRTCRFIYAFVPNAGVTTWTFTPAKFAFLHTIAATTTLGVSLTEAARIHSLDYYCSPTSNGSIITINAAFDGAALGIQGKDQSKQSVTFGSTKGAHVSMKPNATQAFQWQNTTTAATSLWFSLTAQSNNPTDTSLYSLILDLDVSFQCTQNTRTSANTIVLTTATVSDFYYMALDNVGGAGGSNSNLWKPYDLNTTI